MSRQEWINICNCCMLVLRLSFVIVASQLVVGTRQMLYKYMKLCGHKPMNNTVGYSLGWVALTRHSAAHLQPQWHVYIGSLCKLNMKCE